MKSLNRVQLVGRLGKDVSVKVASNGSVYASFRMATDRWHKNKQGEFIRKTSWHNVQVWNAKKAASYADYLLKGSHVLVEGVINYRDYTDKDGIVRHVTDIKASTLVDLDR